MKRIALAAAALSLLASGCNYVKPIMYVNIANHSGSSIRNLEVKYPTGIFGLPELRNTQVHRRMVALGAPCKFTLNFEDESGHGHNQDFHLGQKCPLEVSFDIATGMTVSEREGRP